MPCSLLQLLQVVRLHGACVVGQQLVVAMELMEVGSWGVLGILGMLPCAALLLLPHCCYTPPHSNQHPPHCITDLRAATCALRCPATAAVS